MLTMVARLLALAFVALSFAGTASAHGVAIGSAEIGIEAASFADPAHDDGAVVVATQAELRADLDCDGSHPGAPCCPETHAQCCVSSPALMARGFGLDFAPTAGRAWGGFEAAISSGQRIYPPHRPPRLAA